jgi:cytochrome P450
MVRVFPVTEWYNFLVSPTLFHRAMSNDERDYPEPREFRPERFLKNGQLDPSVRNPMDIAFGFGRR